jgi:hypothetical protein
MPITGVAVLTVALNCRTMTMTTYASAVTTLYGKLKRVLALKNGNGITTTSG